MRHAKNWLARAHLLSDGGVVGGIGQINDGQSKPWGRQLECWSVGGDGSGGRKSYWKLEKKKIVGEREKGPWGTGMQKQVAGMTIIIKVHWGPIVPRWRTTFVIPLSRTT